MVSGIRALLKYVVVEVEGGAGQQGSGPKGVDDLCFHTYGEFSPPHSSPPPSMKVWRLLPLLKRPQLIVPWAHGGSKDLLVPRYRLAIVSVVNRSCQL